MAKRKKLAELITLTDARGVEHTYKPLELFLVGKKNFAVLKSVDGPEDVGTIFRFTMGRDGLPKTFADPTPQEFMAALKELGVGCECECDCHGCGDEKKKAPKAKPKRKAAPKKKAARPAKKRR